MKKHYLALATIFCLTFSILTFVNPQALAFDPFLETCSTGTDEAAICEDSASQTESGNNPLVVTLGNIARVVAFFVGAISVIMIIYGGFRYITSGGDSSALTNARRIITFAVVGLIIAILAFPITEIIVNNVVAVVFLW